MEVAISQIRIKGRYRKDLGDIQALASSMNIVGLLQPVVLDSENRLVAGQRRIEAAKVLGWTKIEAVVAKGLGDALRLLIAQCDENTCRKDFAVSEAVALGKRLEPVEQKAAKERELAGRTPDGQAGGRGRKKPSAKLAEGLGETREKVAAAVGMKRSTYEKAKAVVESGDKKLIDEMDATGKVDRAYKALRGAEKLDEEQANARKIKPGKRWKMTAAQDVVPCAALITDPPYGILDEPWEPKQLESFTREWCGRWAGCGADTALIFWSQRYLWDGRRWFDEALAGYEFQQLLVWHYPNNKSPQSRQGFKQTWEPIFFYRRKGSDREVLVSGGAWGDDLTDFDCHVAAVPQSNFNDADAKQHPAQKPVSVMRWLINAVTKPGELVCDPFAGSGTTGIAAVQLGRRFHGIENNPEYLEIAKGRIATHAKAL